MFSSAVRVGGVFLAAFVMVPRTPAAQAPAVPDVVVRAKCVACHAIDLLQQQRLSRAAWERELDKMTRWGAVVVEPDRSALLDYLEANRSSESTPNLIDGRGAEVFKERCLGCHGSDIIEQQRLGSTAWRREVTKMTAWGAGVRAEEADSLVSYLTDRFGPR